MPETASAIRDESKRAGQSPRHRGHAEMTSVRTSGYRVPILHNQRLLFGLTANDFHHKHSIPRRDLEKRLDSLRQVKLELEEENERKKQCIKFLVKRLDTANSALYSKGDVHRVLFKSEEQLKRARLRMKELGARIVEKTNDYDRLQNTVDKFRDEYKCQGPCGKVRSYKCFARDPEHITGRERRCNLCQSAKTARWRAAKKYQQQGGG